MGPSVACPLFAFPEAGGASLTWLVLSIRVPRGTDWLRCWDGDEREGAVRVAKSAAPGAASPCGVHTNSWGLIKGVCCVSGSGWGLGVSVPTWLP